MSRDEVLKLWRQRPFAPFRITTVAGATVDVMHPNLMLVAGDMLTIGTPDPDEPPPAALDGIWLSFGDITRAEPLQAAAQH